MVARNIAFLSASILIFIHNFKIIIKMKYFSKLLIYIMLTLFLQISCTKEVKQIKTTKIFISEYLQNRNDEHYSSQSEKHDRGCIGFYTRHFDYSKLNSIKELEIKNLKELTNLNWSVYKNFDQLIDFESVLNKKYLNKVIYVIEEIYSEKNSDIDFLVGADDGLQLWINGNFIYEIHDGRYSYKEELIKLPIRKGKNIILYKIDQSYGGWQLSRHFPDKEEVKILLDELKYEVYSDLPESCIINDSARTVEVKIDKLKKEKILKKNNISSQLVLTWKNFENGNLFDIENSSTFESLRNNIKIPQKFNGSGFIEFSVRDMNNIEYYTEGIPIYRNSTANYLVKTLCDESAEISDPIIIERRKAIIDLFHLNEMDTINLKREYSTRLQAIGLFDLQIGLIKDENNNITHFGPTIMGYYSKSSKETYMYRAYFPYSKNNTHKKFPLLFVIPHIKDPKQIDNLKFLHRTSGRHSVVKLWTELSTVNNFLIVQSEGQDLKNFRGSAVEEFPLILKQLNSYTKIDTSKIYFYCSSSGALVGLQMLINSNLNVIALGFSGAALNIEKNELIKALKIIKMKYPNILFFIRHGDKDRNFPLPQMNKVVDILKSLDFNINYNIIKGGSHTLDYDVIAKEFFRCII